MKLEQAFTKSEINIHSFAERLIKIGIDGKEFVSELRQYDRETSEIIKGEKRWFKSRRKEARLNELIISVLPESKGIGNRS